MKGVSSLSNQVQELSEIERENVFFNSRYAMGALSKNRKRNADLEEPQNSIFERLFISQTLTTLE